VEWMAKSWGSFGLVWSAGAVLSVHVDDAVMDLKRLLSLYLMRSWTSWRAGQFWSSFDVN